ncbi:unnamed protein product [Cuscuta epithymum]|uniref:Uncharacterized protein n=1 Tax=Cuscuta epithymum TaxID=186058 RepID=A0AAV0DK99_9ASTE|nr:unnamed protein product [Cuscuta epithymum]
MVWTRGTMEARVEELEKNRQETKELLAAILARLDARDKHRSRSRSHASSTSHPSYHHRRTQPSTKLEATEDRSMNNRHHPLSSKEPQKKSRTSSHRSQSRTESSPSQTHSAAINSRSRKASSPFVPPNSQENSSGTMVATRTEDPNWQSLSESPESQHELKTQKKPSVEDSQSYGNEERKENLSVNSGPVAGAITSFPTFIKPSRYELLSSELETKMMWSIERGSQIDKYLQVKINQIGKSIPISRGIHSPATGDSLVKPLKTSTIFDLGKEVFLVADVIAGLHKIDGFRFDDVDQSKRFILEHSHDLARNVNRFPIVHTGLINVVKHQKYLAVTNKNGNGLLHFIIVANGAIQEITVKEGSEAARRMGIHSIMTDVLDAAEIQGMELQPIVESMRKYPKIGLLNPCKSSERYLRLGDNSAKTDPSISITALPDVVDIIAGVLKKTTLESYQQALGEAVAPNILENFHGDPVHFMTRSFGVPGHHLGQKNQDSHWTYDPLAIVTSFNAAVEFSDFQLMGALYNGNKTSLKKNSRVCTTMEQMLIRVHDWGIQLDIELFSVKLQSKDRVKSEANAMLRLDRSISSRGREVWERMIPPSTKYWEGRGTRRKLNTRLGSYLPT